MDTVTMGDFPKTFSYLLLLFLSTIKQLGHILKILHYFTHKLCIINIIKAVINIIIIIIMKISFLYANFCK